jgi:primase-polymerase (primpol)-like protein
VLKLATAYIEKEVSKVSTQDDRPIGEIIGGKLYPAKQLADQEGANIKDARVAMEDAGQDVEKARALLRERDQVDTPEKRRAKRRAWR